MTLSQLGSATGRQPAAACKVYDERAGETALRRAAKAAEVLGVQRAPQRAEPAKERVARELNDYYQSMLRQPVPARFVRLLDALEAQTQPR